MLRNEEDTPKSSSSVQEWIPPLIVCSSFFHLLHHVPMWYPHVVYTCNSEKLDTASPASIWISLRDLQPLIPVLIEDPWYAG